MKGERITTKAGLRTCNQLAGYCQPPIYRSVYSFAKILNELPAWSNPDQKNAAPIKRTKIKNIFLFSRLSNLPKIKMYKKYPKEIMVIIIVIMFASGTGLKVHKLNIPEIIDIIGIMTNQYFLK